MNMFYNTGIATYIWLLDNTKQPERVGKVQLIDANSFFTKLRKNLGAKSREIREADRDRIVRIYSAFDGQEPDDAEYSKVFSTRAFGYYTVSVERPVRDERGQPVYAPKGKNKGQPQPDSKLRETESVPIDLDPTVPPEATIKTYFAKEVQPHVADGWIDCTKTKVGYEIPFARHFYKYVPPRPLSEIDADLNSLASEIVELLTEIEK